MWRSIPAIPIPRASRASRTRFVIGRAALGISEESDAIAVVVSEETGAISIAHAGRMIRRIDPERLENILLAFFRPSAMQPSAKWYARLFPYLFTRRDERNVK